jgi:nicotinamide riboside transporter PnuC
MEHCIKLRRTAFWTGLLLAVFAVALITWTAWFNPWKNPPRISDATTQHIQTTTDPDRLRGIALKLVEMHTALLTDVGAIVRAWAVALATFLSVVALFLIWLARAMRREINTLGSSRIEP